MESFCLKLILIIGKDVIDVDKAAAEGWNSLTYKDTGKRERATTGCPVKKCKRANVCVSWHCWPWQHRNDRWDRCAASAGDWLIITTTSHRSANQRYFMHNSATVHRMHMLLTALDSSRSQLCNDTWTGVVRHQITKWRRLQKVISYDVLQHRVHVDCHARLAWRPSRSSRRRHTTQRHRQQRWLRERREEKQIVAVVCEARDTILFTKKLCYGTVGFLSICMTHTLTMSAPRWWCTQRLGVDSADQLCTVDLQLCKSAMA